MLGKFEVLEEEELINVLCNDLLIGLLLCTGYYV